MADIDDADFPPLPTAAPSTAEQSISDAPDNHKQANGHPTHQPTPSSPEPSTLYQRLNSILSISTPDGTLAPQPPAAEPANRPSPTGSSTSLSTTPESATLKDWMARLLSPASASALRRVHVPDPALLSPPSHRRSLSQRSVSAPSTSRSRSRERGEPIVIRSSPRASEDLDAALNEEMFPFPRVHLPLSQARSTTSTTRANASGISRPARVHLSPADSPLSPPGSVPDHHTHHPPPPQLLTSLTRSTLPTASLSLQPLPAAHLSTSTAQIRRSSSLFSRAGMGLGRLAREDSTSSVGSGSGGSVEQLRMLYSSPTRERDESSWGDSWGEWWRTGKERDRSAPLLEPEDRGKDQQESAENIQRKYKTPQNPLIFCHGLLGFDELSFPLPPPLGSFSLPPIYHWRGITDVLRTNGVEVYVMRVPATSGIEERAKVLRDQVNEKCKGRKVHLIGHSMGGLDCRYLASRLECEFEVLTVTTVATPHRGSSFADYFVHSLIGRERLPSVISLIDTLLPYSNGDGTAFEQLTMEHMRAFNDSVPDRPGVRYFSWGATYEPGLVDSFRWPHGVILAKEGPNDGLVSVESAKWGTYLGTVQHVNHLDLIGWMNAARYRWAEFVGTKIEYRPATFYLGVANQLAEVEEEMDRREREDGGVD